MRSGVPSIPPGPLPPAMLTGLLLPAEWLASGTRATKALRSGGVPRAGPSTHRLQLLGPEVCRSSRDSFPRHGSTRLSGLIHAWLSRPRPGGERAPEGWDARHSSGLCYLRWSVSDRDGEYPRSTTSARAAPRSPEHLLKYLRPRRTLGPSKVFSMPKAPASRACGVCELYQTGPLTVLLLRPR